MEHGKNWVEQPLGCSYRGNFLILEKIDKDNLIQKNNQKRLGRLWGGGRGGRIQEAVSKEKHSRNERASERTSLTTGA